MKNKKIYQENKSLIVIYDKNVERESNDSERNWKWEKKGHLHSLILVKIVFYDLDGSSVQGSYGFNHP